MTDKQLEFHMSIFLAIVISLCVALLVHVFL